uniref:Ras and Rab interactor 1 n=2 Tax=Mus TaxID=862507 RepID=A0A286YDL8_MOUSE
MEDPGETGAHPLGATNLNFVPGHQQKENCGPTLQPRCTC